MIAAELSALTSNGKASAYRANMRSRLGVPERRAMHKP